MIKAKKLNKNHKTIAINIFLPFLPANNQVIMAKKTANHKNIKY